jgi:hypothetical protein
MIRFLSIALVVLLVMAASGCGGGSSGQVQPPPPPPVPTISAITPPSAIRGTADLKLTLTGSNFLGATHNFSQAAWVANGNATLLMTTFVSSTQLTAVVPAALLTDPITAQVLLETGDPMGDLPLTKSNSVSFSVSNPPFSITSILPTRATAGSPDLSLTVMGSNFDGAGVIRSRVLWSANGAQIPLSTTFVSSSELSAIVPAALLLSAGTVSILVQNWDHIEGVSDGVTNSITFTVKPSTSSAALLSPPSATLGPSGARQFVFSIDGQTADATWVVEEGAAGGTVTSSGLYTAPSKPGTYHVAATAVMDSSKTATASVSVGSSGFTLIGSMSAARSGHIATLLANGKVLIVGGDDSAELFDPASETFTSTGKMTTLRYGPTATLLANGMVLIVGGFGPGTSQLPRLSSAELYDAGSGTFTATGSMAVSRVLHTATLLDDGRVLIAGGTDASGGGGAATATAELYDPSTGTFTLTGSMASERAHYTATLLASGKVLIVGGWNGHAADAADDPPWDPLFAELFDPLSASFTASGSMSTTRIGSSAIRLANGKVLVLGGVPSLQNVHQQPQDPQYAEIYDPPAGTFSSAGNFTLSRSGYTATLLTNGTVLIAGGEQAGVAVTSAELLDPTTGTLSLTGGLVIARKGHTATRLKDGRVLVTGGTDRSGEAVSSAELYH